MERRPPDLIGLQEAMSLLHVSRATLDRWRKEKQLPHIKIGKEVMFDKTRLHEWMARYAAGSPLAESAARISVPVVKIGYQSGAALLWSQLVIKASGWLEEELKLLYPRHTPKVEWINAPNGMELVEQLVKGELHIASVGDYPMMASRMLAALLPGFQPQVLAFDGKTKDGNGISLVSSAVRSMGRPEPLSASSISVVGHSSSSYRLKEWMDVLDIGGEPTFYRGMGDCLSGIMDGTARAGILWEPYLSWIVAAGAGQRVLPEGVGGDYLTGLLADRLWAQHHEPIVVAYLKAHLRAHRLLRQDPHRAAALIQRASGFPGSLIGTILGRIHWDSALYGRDLLTLSADKRGRTGDTLPEQKASEDLSFSLHYLQEAAAALAMPVLPDAPLPGEWSTELLY